MEKLKNKDSELLKKLEKKKKNENEPFKHDRDHPLLRVLFNTYDDYYSYWSLQNLFIVKNTSYKQNNGLNLSFNQNNLFKRCLESIN